MKKSSIIISVLIFIIFVLVFCFIYYYGVLIFNKKNDSGRDVSIIDVQIRERFGDVSSDSAPIFDKTTVTFKDTFDSPGDSITYDIIINNSGEKEVKLNDIIIGKINNKAIVVKLYGLKKGQILQAGESLSAQVIIRYDENAQKSSEPIKSSLTVKLDYTRV